MTNESLHEDLRAHAGDHLLDFPEVDDLPQYAREGLEETVRASVAQRILLCSDVKVEVLESRIAHLLTRHGHVPIQNHSACGDALRAAVRERMEGIHPDVWTKSDLLGVLSAHGGSVLPTRAMDHYIKPQSFDEIREALENRHVVLIAGPSGTGKTLTADVLEQELRVSATPFAVVTEEKGPNHVRSCLVCAGSQLFHLRDPWGGNRLSPEADRWTNELPKLLSNAAADRKFLITSRSDVLGSAGLGLVEKLQPYTVEIEIDDYGLERLSQIYDGISGDLSGHAAELARSYRSAALRALTRPYEIDRFLEALSRQDPSKPRRAEDLIKDSQIEAISRVVADQVSGWGDDGVGCATILWAMLRARGAIPLELVPRLMRRIRQQDSALRPNVDGFVGFLIAGRNLRKDTASVSFAHPKVEDGLRMSMLREKGEAEYVLSKLGDSLAAWDKEGSDWGIETVLEIRRSVQQLEGIELELGDASQKLLDDYVDCRTVKAVDHHNFERALTDLAHFCSDSHIPGKLAKILVDGRPPGPGASSFLGFPSWRVPDVDAGVLDEIRLDATTSDITARFVRDVLPFSDTGYPRELVELLGQFGLNLQADYLHAFESMVVLGGPSRSIDASVAGLLSGDSPDFESAIGRIISELEKIDDWWENNFRDEWRRAEEHEVDAGHAQHIFDEPGERNYNATEALKSVLGLRREREGIGWIREHPNRQRLLPALVASMDEYGVKPKPSTEELRLLLECGEENGRAALWRLVGKHWDSRLRPQLKSEISRSDLGSRSLREALAELIAKLSESPRDAVEELAGMSVDSPLSRRLELVVDLMDVDLDTDNSLGSSRKDRVGQASELASKFPELAEADLGRALAEVLAGGEIASVGESLSEPARQLLGDILPSVSPSVAGPLCCLGAAIGIDPVPVSEHLLETEEYRGRYGSSNGFACP